MLEGDVIGNTGWTKGFLCDADVNYLEALDSEMRVHNSSQNLRDARSYEELVEDCGAHVPTHCEHGVSLSKECALCRAFLA